MKTDYSVSNSTRNTSNIEVSPFWIIEKYSKCLANIVLKYLAWNFLQNFHVSTRYVKTFQQDLLKYFNKILFNISIRFVEIFQQIWFIWPGKDCRFSMFWEERHQSMWKRGPAFPLDSLHHHLSFIWEWCRTFLKAFFLFLGNILFPKIILQPHTYNPSGVLD